jgi:hypothetical protein
MKTQLPMVVKKECGTCTKCCEGWLSADIKGHKMYPGKPCFFVEIGKGCKDYKNRPKEPCKNFTCGWIEIEDMPEKFKPEFSGVIMHSKPNNGNPYLVLSNAPSNPTEQYLSWAIVYARSRGANIFWQIDNRFWWLGNDEFCEQMKIEHTFI